MKTPVRRLWCMLPLCLTLALALTLSACRTPTPVTPSLMDLPPDCPEEPPAMSGIEELEALARSTREARANLMTRMEGGPEPLFATLHPIELSLMEAILDAPGKARSMDAPWLRQHLLSISVVVHAQRPLEALDGDADRARLADGQGREHSALYMTVQSDSKGWLYRFFFDPQVAVVQDSMARLTFRLQLKRSSARASWALSQRNLAALEGLPIQHLLIPLQRMRWARWDLLTGDHAAAAEDAEQIAYCAPNRPQAAVLKSAVGRTPPSVSPPTRKLALASSPDSDAPERGADLMLRAALLNRLLPLGQAGLLPAKELRRAQEMLEQGVQHLARGKLRWELPAALLEIDRIIAKVLADALDVNGPLHPEDPALGSLEITGGPHLPDDVVTQELQRRVVLANMNLVPRWIKRPVCKDQHCRSGNILLVQRPVLKATVDSVEIWAKAHLTMGWGWIHPGLPPHTYTVSFADHSNDYWRDQVNQVKELTALRTLSRRILAMELMGPHGDSAALAMMGIYELNQADQAQGITLIKGSKLFKGVKGLRNQLTPLLKDGSPDLQAAALRVLALLNKGQSFNGLLQGLSSPHPALRAVALDAIGNSGRLLTYRASLLAGIRDPDPRVRSAAFTTLMRAQDPIGFRTARTWLTGSAEERAMALDTLVRRNLRGQGLAPLLLKQLETAQPSAQTDQALVVVIREMGARAAPSLTKIYNNNQKLRSMIIKAVGGVGFSKLLTRAAQEEDPELRRDALLKLSQQKRPPQALLEKAAEDPHLGVRLAAHIALARQGRARSLLALGAGARGSCIQRAMVLPPLCKSMDSGSRRQLLLDAMNSDCVELFPLVWKLILQFHPEDVELLKAFIKHPNRMYRVQGALAALGLRRGAALGQIP